MSEWTRRSTIVIPASRLVEATALAVMIDPEGGNNTFRVGLSPTGSEPATHYWCSGVAREEDWAAITQLAGFAPDGPGGWAYVNGWKPEPAYLYDDGDPGYDERVLRDRGLVRVQAQED